MSDNSMPETLETIAAKIDALRKSNDERFATVDQQFAETRADLGARIEALSKSSDQRFGTIDQRFGTIDQRFDTIDQRFAKIDQQFAETRAHLGVKIEAVDAKVVKVYDEVIAMRDKSKRNAAEHKSFTKRLDNHDLRLLALEQPGPPKP